MDFSKYKKGRKGSQFSAKTAPTFRQKRMADSPENGVETRAGRAKKDEGLG